MFELKENPFDRINSASPMRDQAPDPENQFQPEAHPDPQITNFTAKDPHPMPVNHYPNSHINYLRKSPPTIGTAPQRLPKNPPVQKTQSY
jgi:hypothetical protein